MAVTFDREIAYTEDAASEVLRLTRLGNVPLQYCALLQLDNGAPDRWAHENPTFAAEYDKARLIGADAMMSECVHIADRPDLKADAKKVMMEARKNCAALWNPSKYGPQADKQPTGGIGAMINMDYHQLDPVKKAAVDKFFGTDDDD